MGKPADINEKELSQLTPEELISLDETDNKKMNELVTTSIGNELLYEGHQSYRNIEDFDRSCKEEDDRMAKVLEGDDDAYGQYLFIANKERREKRAALVKACAADARVSTLQSKENQCRFKNNERIRTDEFIAASDFLEKQEQTKFCSESIIHGSEYLKSDADRKRTAVENSKTFSEEDKKEIKEGISTDLVIGGVKLAELTKAKQTTINEEYKAKIRGRADKVIDFSKEIWKDFLMAYVPYVKTGYMSYQDAYNRACEMTRKEIIYYFNERAAKGEYSVVNILDEMQKRSDENFEKSKLAWNKDGTPILDDSGKQKKSSTPDGAVNIYDLACLRNSDIREIKNSALSYLKEDTARRKAEEAASNAANMISQDKLEDLADSLLLEANETFSKNLYATDDPIKAVSELFPKINALKGMGYRKSSELYNKILSSANKIVDTRKSYDEQVKKASNEENMNHFVEMWNRYRTTSANEVYLSFATPNGIVGQTEGVTSGTETRAALIALGSSILRNGNLTDDKKKYYGECVDKLKKDKRSNDVAIVEKLAKDVGFCLPQEQEKNVFSYRQMAFTPVDNAPSRQIGDDVLLDEKGKPMMGDWMTVTCRIDGGNPFNLGKNEATKIFLNMLDIVERTPSDEMTNKEAYDSLVSQFKHDLKVAAGEVDNNKRLSRIVSLFDERKKVILGNGNDLNYLTPNYRTPVEHQREIDYRKWAKSFDRPLSWQKPDWQKND